jgi:hypothetical protein
MSPDAGLANTANSNLVNIHPNNSYHDRILGPPRRLLAAVVRGQRTASVADGNGSRDGSGLSFGADRRQCPDSRRYELTIAISDADRPGEGSHDCGRHAE